MKNPVAYSLPPLSAKPKAGAALRGRTKRMTRTRRSPVATPTARLDPDVVVDAVDVAYIFTLQIENFLIDMWCDLMTWLSKQYLVADKDQAQ